MKYVVCAVVFVFLALSVDAEPCVTPDGSKGNCVEVLICAELAKIALDQQQTPEQISLLQKSACGFEKSMPKVCCPKSCVTLDGEQGSCVNRSSCSILSKTEKAKSCMDSGSICCPPLNTQPKESCEKSLSALPFPKDSFCCGTDSVTDIKFSYAGGQAQTDIDQYPWLALLEYQFNNKTKLMCGGSLISGRYVMTAAHCITGNVLRYGKPTGVRLGEYDTTKDVDCAETRHGGGIICASANDTVTIPVESLIPHPEYDPITKKNDIGLIRLGYLAPYTDFIKPICLPTRDYRIEKVPVFNLFVAGWGSSSYRNMAKQDVLLEYVEQTKCQNLFTKLNVTLGSGHICAEGANGKNPCRGDSGGPLMFNKGSRFEALGVMSFGALCQREEIPTVFTKVNEYIDWIYDVIEP